MRLAFRLLLYYAAFVAVVALLQRRMIYQATRLNTAEAINAAAANGLQPWKNFSGEIIGWRTPAHAAATATILICHGNAGWAGARAYIAAPASAAGPADVFILEYPGYGARRGHPSMTSLLAAAGEAFDLLPKDRPICLVSESLGAGPAAHLARRHGSVIAGLLAFVPYHDFAAVAQRRMPFVPARWLLRDRFTPAQWLAPFSGPALFVLAGADEVIPVEFGQKLHDRFGGRKRVERIAGAGHNDVAAQPVDWWREVFAFWRQTSP